MMSQVCAAPMVSSPGFSTVMYASDVTFLLVLSLPALTVRPSPIEPLTILREREREGLRPSEAVTTLCGRDREAIRATKSSSSLLIRASTPKGFRRCDQSGA